MPGGEVVKDDYRGGDTAEFDKDELRTEKDQQTTFDKCGDSTRHETTIAKDHFNSVLEHGKQTFGQSSQKEESFAMSGTMASNLKEHSFSNAKTLHTPAPASMRTQTSAGDKTEMLGQLMK